MAVGVRSAGIVSIVALSGWLAYRIHWITQLPAVFATDPYVRLFHRDELVIEFDITLVPTLTSGDVVTNQSTLYLDDGSVFALSDDRNVNGPADPTVAGDEDPTRVTIEAPELVVTKSGPATMNLGQWGDFVLFKDSHFAEKCIAHLEDDVDRGAIGLKVTKELGLAFKDRNGAMIRVDDERLFPVWKRT